jgi:hypothetical protein
LLQQPIRFKKSNDGGSWSGVVVGSQFGGDGNVFATTATIDQNDCALVPINTTTIRAYRRNAGGTGSMRPRTTPPPTRGPAGVDNGPLHALKNGVSGGNGVYRYGGIAFPTSTFNSNNYWVDVVFVPQ